MQVIPVIDLKNNVVVHAKLGDRQNYQAINTPLCASAEAFAVIEAFLRLHPFTGFYIADLDAITGQGNHDALIDDILTAFPDKVFWVDKGYQACPAILKPKNYWPVLGSECYTDALLGNLKNFNDKFILSLDFAISGALGAAELFTYSQLWPEQIIVMNLSRVGSNQGPDFGKLQQFIECYPQKRFIASGGIRHLADLQQLSQLGIQQVLIASALHSGAITADDLVKNVF